MGERGRRVTTLTDEEITRRLHELEDRFNMTSDQFLLTYHAGGLDDRPEFIDWAGLRYVAQRAVLSLPAHV